MSKNTLNAYSSSVPLFIQMLTSAKSWLDKAEAHATAKKFDVAVLLDARLAPDMFPMRRQLQIATDHAKGLVARLTGVEIPKWADTEMTVAELKARLDRALDYLNAADPAAFEGAEDRDIVITWPGGERRFVGADYVRHYAVPNFMFHMTTAYAILRHNGVDLGKGDYLRGGM